MKVSTVPKPAPPQDASAQLARQDVLVSALCEQLRRTTGDAGVQLIQTHISYVVLAGERAYKVRKAVELGFLDFSTLERRRDDCERELRLNARLAPSLYLRVVPITGTFEAPQLNGTGSAIEYAVEMKRFAQSALLSHVAERDALTPERIDALADTIAGFHRRAGVAGPASAFGCAASILDKAIDNCDVLRRAALSAADRGRLSVVEAWTRREHESRREAFEQRRRDGFVRECHGDLHLGNIVGLDDAVVPFDCIEFNDDLRWIDVQSEIAFTVMDLEVRGEWRLAARLLNRYLERTGDYEGLRVFRFYVVYRAMVRAKVAALRAMLAHDQDVQAQARAECTRHLALAARHCARSRRALSVTHGCSGSGKTTLSQDLVERSQAIRFRSDVERKRRHGLSALERSDSPKGEGLYAPGSTLDTYRQLAKLARCAIDSGFAALVDATFLKRWQREALHTIAREAGVAFAILTFAAPVSTLRERVTARARDRRDASEADLAVLEAQLAGDEPLTVDEKSHELVIDTQAPLDRIVGEAWTRWVHALKAPDPPQTIQEPSLAEKMAFLEDPRSHGQAHPVRVVETHLSWVFLTDGEVYKLKKPVHNDFVDLRTCIARGQNCSEEVALNRRLAGDVYEGVIALAVENGRIAWEDGGAVVEWLVRMRRLPSDRMLDAAIRSGTLAVGELDAVIDKLCAFYRTSVAAPCDPESFCARFERGIARNAQTLSRFSSALPVVQVEGLIARQYEVLARPGLVGARGASGRVVEGHGDLRPEHVALGPPPVIIDCLEFSRELRTLDSVDELAFLALECERLGAPELKDAIFARYVARTGDAVPPGLIDFYQSFRACVRASLAIGHLDDAGVADRPRWERQARSYLELAIAHIAAVGT